MTTTSTLSSLLTAWRKLHARQAALAGRARAWLDRLAPRERRLLAAAAAVAAAALAWLVLVEPAWTAVRDLGRELPQLRAQAATVADLAARARALQRGGRRTAGALPTETELRASLQQAGIGAGQWEVVARQAGDASSSSAASHTAASSAPGAVEPAAPPAAGTVALRFTEVSAAAALRWLDGAPRDWRLVVTSADLTRPRDADDRRLPGRLSGTVTLAPYDNAAAAR